MDLINALKDFSNQTAKAVDSINAALPKLMENLSEDEKKELTDTLKNQNWASVKDKLAKTNEMISNLPV